MKKPEILETAFNVYRVGRQLGQGGAGYVFEVIEAQGEGKHAAKILDSTRINADSRRRFKNEYKFCNRCCHPRIVPATDYGLSESGAPFFVMPLFDGSLRDVIDKLTPASAVEIFLQILDGVEAAHLNNVVHRDLKPENILFRGEMSQPQVVISDFGISRFTNNDLFTDIETKAGVRLANFQYAAPEQRMRGRPVDHRADIYSLGLIFNELFTKELAVGEGYTLVSKVAADHAFLDPIISRMLQQDPDRRFGSIGELRRSLGAAKGKFLEGQKLDRLRGCVVPEGEITDPLVLDPPRLVDVDWNAGVLRLKFQHRLNQGWLNALYNMGGYTSIMGSEPHTVRIIGEEACIPASSNSAEQVLNHFKQWLPRANAVYRTTVQQAVAAEKREREEELKAELRATEERQRVRQLLSV
ncbi:MAG: serine/threonine protein kinase [Thermoanaerobaculia bacterium]|nr:serine/threonine protein kinase [Thermoanaerobaculia bacterium]